MTLHLASAFFMILSQAFLLAYMWQEFLVPGVLVAIAFFGWVTNLRVTISPPRQIMFSLIIAMLFAVRWRYFYTEDAMRASVILDEGLGFSFAEFCLSMQALAFVVYRRQLPAIFVLFAVAGTTFAGDRVALNDMHITYTVGSLAVMLGGIGFAATSNAIASAGEPIRWARPRIASVVAIVLGLTTAIATGEIIDRNGNKFDVLLANLAWLTQPTKPGFSRSPGRLGSVNESKFVDSESIALRVYSDFDPGYLRGRAFNRFEDLEWRVDGERSSVAITSSPPKGFRRLYGFETVFRVRDRPLAEAPLLEAEIWPVRPFEYVFARLDTEFVVAGFMDLSRDSSDSISTLQAAPQYTGLLRDQEPRSLAESERTRYLEIPANLDPGIRVLADRIFEACRTDSDKIDAVQEYFTANYSYTIGIDVPPGEDPLAHFLLTEPPPPAHCEYFATASAVLLRLGGVPSRYVTGFLASEWNAEGGYWVARNKHAHAWVEAFDEKEGWVTVESTPPDGVPDGDAPRQFAQVWDAIKFRLLQTWAAIRQGRFAELALALLYPILAVVVWLTTTVAGWSIILATAVAILGYRWRKWRRYLAGLDPRVVSYHRLLARMDRHVRRIGYQRYETETLGEFATRLRASSPECASVASWYGYYAQARFDQPSTAMRPRELELALHDAIRPLKAGGRIDN